MNDAEQYLQMAARWSQSPKESAITLNNLGTLSYMKLGHALREKNETKNITNRDLLYFSKKCIIDRPILSNIQLNLLNDAINYWEEAVEESSADKDAVNNSQQVQRGEEKTYSCQT